MSRPHRGSRRIPSFSSPDGGSSASRHPSSLSTQATILPLDRNLTEGLTPTPLHTINQPTTGSTEKRIEVKNLRYVGSYNWTRGSSPTIIVPGSPPEWQDRPTPYAVPADTGLVFVDQNGFRMPSAVLLPLITAVDKKCEHDNQPSFDWGSVDFVTDRNGLRKLLRWIAGSTTKDFRIDMQLAGKHTILMNRWEKRTREELSGCSFGFNFEKASTKPAPGCSESSGHHRIISYDLNGLKMVVRFEVDACIPSTSRSRTAQPPPNVDDLADSLAGIALSTASAPSGTAAPSLRSQRSPTLTVKSGGSHEIPHSAIVELTTRSVVRAHEYDWKEAYPQLFFSQTPHHFLAVHQRGRFTSVTKRSLDSEELRRVDADVQPSLKKLRHALDVIKDLVIKNGERGRLSLVCQKGVLRVFERTSQESCLPDEFMERFETKIE